jgi:hypothetical protein
MMIAQPFDMTTVFAPFWWAAAGIVFAGLATVLRAAVRADRPRPRASYDIALTPGGAPSVDRLAA